MKLDVRIENLTSIQAGWAGVIDGPSGEVGDADAMLQLQLKDVKVRAANNWMCWGKFKASMQDVTPSPSALCGEGVH